MQKQSSKIKEGGESHQITFDVSFTESSSQSLRQIFGKNYDSKPWLRFKPCIYDSKIMIVNHGKR